MTSRFNTDSEIKERVAALLRESAPQIGVTEKRQKFALKKYLPAIAVGICTTALALYFLFQSPAPAYSGRITDPPPGSETSRRVTISGYTENMPPELPYAIIAVDVPDLRLTWPKRPFIEPNTKFRITFYEGGPAGPCKVSLYAINHDMHKKITTWFQEQRLSGMPMFQDRFRLGSTTVIINNSI